MRSLGNTAGHGRSTALADEHRELSALPMRDVALRAYLCVWRELQFNAELTRLQPVGVERARQHLQQRLRMEVRRHQRWIEVQSGSLGQRWPCSLRFSPFIASTSLHPRERHRAPMKYLVTV
jgi:hypothetical protein